MLASFNGMPLIRAWIWITVWIWLAGASLGEEVVDLELVLAIDTSGSVDTEEFRLQVRGTANAFRDAAVQQAILAGPTGRIAVSVVLWADATLHPAATAWSILANGTDIDAFARIVETLPRTVGGGTGIGAAIAAAITHMDNNAIAAPRRVVDVSGDGKETPPRDVGILLVPQARAMARARSVTVNGLAILSDLPDLARWYSANVTVGPGSFVVQARDYADFERAMRQKLLRELTPPISTNGPQRRIHASRH